MPLPPDPTVPTDNPPPGKAGGTYGQKDVGRAARSTDAMTTRAGEELIKPADDSLVDVDHRKT